MRAPVLTDKSRFPTEEVIAAHLGRSVGLWSQFFEGLHRRHPDFTEDWRYYTDGKSWLMKVSRKGKTVFWLSVVEGAFRISCYFTAKAVPAIAKSVLSDELKKQLRSGQKSGKIRGLTVLCKSKRDIGYALRLVALKVEMGR
jgi:hypothetical protein